MICPICGETLNVIDEDHVECHECGFTGTVHNVYVLYDAQSQH